MSRSIGSHVFGKARATNWGIMSKSIGSHILLGKLVLPNWDFPAIYRLEAVEKDASKDREHGTNMAAIAPLMITFAAAPCHGCLHSACVSASMCLLTLWSARFDRRLAN